MGILIHMNDPAVPAAKETNLPLLPSPCPYFVVQGFTGKGSGGSAEHHAAIVHVFVSHTLNFVQQYLPSPISTWSSTPNLRIYPRAGSQLNAYYDRSSMRFFYQKHPVTRETIYLCESSDVVCHELGHAILDALRPELWNNPSIEVAAFHESFSDCVSILSTLHHPEMLDYVLAECGGDLMKHNSVARIAEQMGEALFHMAKPNSGRAAEYLRCAINDFHYMDPQDIPNTTPDNLLSRSSHNFGRIFTGCFYQLLVGLYEMFLKDAEPKAALEKARDRAGRALMHAACQSVVTPRFFESVGKTMVRFACLDGADGAAAMTKAFRDKKVFGVDTLPLLYGGDMSENIGREPTIVKLSDFVEGDNPLYKVEVELCHPITFMYNPAGDHVDHQTVQAAKVALDHLVAADKVDYEANESPEKEFRVEDGRLVRNYFSCY